jgi:hypothetical protein
MSKLYRIGDLITVLKSFNPTEHYYCRIVDIIDENGESHSSYDIVTGHGDSNSKVRINAFSLGIESQYKTKIEVLEQGHLIEGIDPHNAYLVSNDDEIKKSEFRIKCLTENIKFFEKNRNVIELREERINKVLEIE